MKKLIFILLTLPFLFASCTQVETPAPETTAAVPETTLPEETTEPIPEELSISIAGVDISEYIIIHNGSKASSEMAKELRKIIKDALGCTLQVKTHTAKETEREILVGKTNRAASAEVRASFTRPNVYYNVRVIGEKLVVMGEGRATLEKLSTVLTEYFSSLAPAPTALEGTVISGDILDTVNKNKNSMWERAEGTDLRVFHWNMAAPYLDPNVTTPPVVYTDNVTRGEDIADMILQFLPDIITTNEFYASHNGNTVFFDAVMGELGEYYVCLDSPYDKGKPEAGADAISGKTINSNIIYRKDIGLEVVSSAWRYSTQKTNTSSKNPMGFIYYHGSHTAVFSYKGQNFILSTAHYADSRSSSQWAKEQLAAIADAQSAFSSPLPVILTGDLYTGRTQSSPDSAYKYLVANGYVDSQQSAPLNGNQNRSHGTFHKIGTRETNRISEDFVWCKGELQPLAFKVLVNKISDDASDHYPVMADIKFN
jgi:endonuclease/exonuclease/phosphatase family metal-dependent hydrolase